MGNKIKVKRFIFPIGTRDEWELPSHWVPFQVEVMGQAGELWVWAYRNGNT